MLLNFITILGFNFIVITILWISSLKTRRADFIDIYWGPSFFFSFLLALVINNSFSMTDVDLVPKSCKVEIIPFCEKSPMAGFYPNSSI